MSLALDLSTIARIEADRIYALILPETDGKETVTVPLPFLSNVLTTGQSLEAFAPSYIRVALDRLTETAKIHKLRRKAVIPKESLAFIAAGFESQRIRRKDGLRKPQAYRGPYARFALLQPARAFYGQYGLAYVSSGRLSWARVGQE